MMDEEMGNPLLKIMYVVGFMIAVAITGIVIAYFSGYSIAKKPEGIRWIEAPFTVERNQQGQPIGNIVIGFDEKGYVRWGRTPITMANGGVGSLQQNAPPSSISSLPSAVNREANKKNENRR